VLRSLLTNVIASIIENADDLTELDRLAGDGDLGISLERGFSALSERLEALDLDTPSTAFKQIGQILREHVGGSSGVLYGIFVMTLACSLPEALQSSDITAAQWYAALQAGAVAIASLGGASLGDRTMVCVCVCARPSSGCTVLWLF
jgi:dihydroxyacetone kinase